jgi:hypothetical protein
MEFHIWTFELWRSKDATHKGYGKRFPLIEKPEMICEGCIFGKKHRESFPVGKSYRAKDPLEIVHSDICGPMKTTSIGGSTYFLTFIDDFSRKTWIYFLKHKFDALGCFQ